MPGTGKHGYTGPSLYGGNYNISNGIIQSSSGASGSGASGKSVSAIANKVLNAVSDGITIATNNISQASRNLASGIAGNVGMDPSDYGDYVRELLEGSANNTAMSQAFAREQMDFQRKSDATAMAWSASEAQKNRDWQERLSNTAHQREVQDLITAGLNPILSANQGAFTGSGATGQGFSSSGAMGNVDSSGNTAAGQLFNAMINTASQAMIAGLYTDAERYQADMQYAAAKTSAEASIFNNNNNIDANKAINALNRQMEIQRANINASATMGAASMNAGAIQYSANQAAAASMYGADQSSAAQRYGADQSSAAQRYGYDVNADLQKWLSEHNIKTNPVGYGVSAAQALAGIFGSKPGQVMQIPEYSNSSLFKPWER